MLASCCLAVGLDDEPDWEEEEEDGVGVYLKL